MAGVLAAAPVKVDVQVVHASNGAAHVDPGLEKMRQGFEKAGLRFSSYRRLSEQTLSLTPGKPASVALPGQDGDPHPAARGASAAPASPCPFPPLQTTVELGTDASAFLQAGPHENGQLVLVLTAKSSRRRGGLALPCARWSSSFPRPGGVLQVAANRDEFLAAAGGPPEPSADGRWLAPRDRQAGGTWLGVNAPGSSSG